MRGLTSLDAIAHEAWLGGRRGDLLVATDARRKEVYAAAYLLGDARADRVTEPAVSRAADLPAETRALPTAGRGPTLYGEALPHAVAPLDVSGGALADLAVRRLRETAPGGEPAAGRPRPRLRRSRAALPAPTRRRARPALHEVDPRMTVAQPHTHPGAEVVLRDLEWTDLAHLATLEQQALRRRRVVRGDVVERGSPAVRVATTSSPRPPTAPSPGMPASTSQETWPTS